MEHRSPPAYWYDPEKTRIRYSVPVWLQAQKYGTTMVPSASRSLKCLMPYPTYISGFIFEWLSPNHHHKAIFTIHIQRRAPTWPVVVFLKCSHGYEKHTHTHAAFKFTRIFQWKISMIFVCNYITQDPPTQPYSYIQSYARALFTPVYLHTIHNKYCINT